MFVGLKCLLPPVNSESSWTVPPECHLSHSQRQRRMVKACEFTIIVTDFRQCSGGICGHSEDKNPFFHNCSESTFDFQKQIVPNVRHKFDYACLQRIRETCTKLLVNTLDVCATAVKTFFGCALRGDCALVQTWTNCFVGGSMDSASPDAFSAHGKCLLLLLLPKTDDPACLATHMHVPRPCLDNL